MVPAKLDHPVKEIEPTLDRFNVELMKVSGANVVTKDTHVV